MGRPKPAIWILLLGVAVAGAHAADAARRKKKPKPAEPPPVEVFVTPRGPAPPVTRLLAPAGSSVATVLDLSAYSGNGDLLSIQHSLDAFGIPYRVTSDADTALAAEEMLFVAGRVDSTLPSALRTKLREGLAAWTQRAGRTLWISALYDTGLAKRLGLTIGASSTTRGILRLQPAHPLCRYVDTLEERETWLARTQKSPERFITTRSYASRGGAWGMETVAAYPDGKPGVVVSRHLPTGGRAVVLGAKFNDLVTRVESALTGQHTRGYSNVFEPSLDNVRLWLRAGYEQWTQRPSVRQLAPQGKKAAVILTHDMDSGTAFPPMQQYFMPLQESLGVRSTLTVTTSYRRNGWLSAFYAEPDVKAIIADALRRGFDVQSHSVSHMPDMGRWQPGQPLDDPTGYAPHYSSSAATTTGGTVLPELLISARLLKEDFGIEVRGWRSGHLARPRSLGAMLDGSGYLYDTTETSGTTGGSFPYLMLGDYGSSGKESQVLEIPMAISDSRITERTAEQTAALWLDVTYKNAANGAPTVLLLHPTQPDVKLPPFRAYLEKVAKDPDLWVGSIHDYYSWYRSQGIRSQQP